jgi:methenyltetrahydromethanopterin cyclohydrolase
MSFVFDLNQRAASIADQMASDADLLGIRVQSSESGTRIIDCGINAPGSLEAGLALAQVCLGGLGKVGFVPASGELCSGPAVMVTTDHPVAACMASQYAGWQVSVGKFFAMGSGPMRALGSKEPLLDKIGMRTKSHQAVGVLETRKLPPDEVCRQIATQCGVEPAKLTLLVAPTASQAGTVQVVARSVETSLHKLSELGFDLHRVEAGYGFAPLPPVAADDLVGIGRTNDAILYGGEVTLWVRGDDASIEAIGNRVPSCASPDFGQPFAVIFARYDRDFYKIDPHLFSPARVTFCNLDTGNSFRFGETHPRVIHESFGIRRG